jgi:hypothetical protein
MEKKYFQTSIWKIKSNELDKVFYLLNSTQRNIIHNKENKKNKTKDCTIKIERKHKLKELTQ